jgi:hypothetical protein
VLTGTVAMFDYIANYEIAGKSEKEDTWCMMIDAKKFLDIC